MISSIQFTGKGKSDYITKRKVSEVIRKGISQEEAQDARKYYGRSSEEYKRCFELVEGDYVNPHLVKNLLNRKFLFSPNRINVLFGPNGCGKTTIIKAIAANAMCGSPSVEDGWTSLVKFSPHNLPLEIGEKKRDYLSLIRRSICHIAGNDARVAWDGSPVFYENVSSRRMTSIGDAIGGIIQDGDEEVRYMFGKDKTSSGMMSIWVFNKIRKILESPPVVEKLREQCHKAQSGVNSAWEDAYKANEAYYDLVVRESPKETVPTVLLDEMDKSLGIANVVKLYLSALPSLLHSSKAQFIIVSHSPVILSDDVMESPDYNVISIDEEYTKACREMLSSLKFS